LKFWPEIEKLAKIKIQFKNKKGERMKKNEKGTKQK